jgi:hypothetical protein
MSEPLRGEAHAEAPDDDETTAPPEGEASGHELGPPTAIESLVGALLEAGPDVAEHVVKAAQELLLAVQVIVDAADHAVQEQRDVRQERSSSEPPSSGTDAESDDSVRHLDLAE